MHPSVCCRRQLPLQGSLSKRQSPAKPPLQGEVPPQAAEGCGAWPYQYYQYPFGPPFSCVGADDLIGPPAGLMGSGRSSAAARSRPQCRAGDFARRLGFAVWQGLRDDASIVPYGCKARCCQTLRGIPAVNRQCTPQAAPCGASSSPCRGAFQAADASKTGKTNTARNTAVPGCIVLYRDPGQGVLIRKSLRQTADGTSPPMGGNLAPKRRTLPAQIVLEGRCVKFNHLRAVKKQWITGGCACAGQPDRRQRQPQRAR